MGLLQDYLVKVMSRSFWLNSNLTSSHPPACLSLEAGCNSIWEATINTIWSENLTLYGRQMRDWMLGHDFLRNKLGINIALQLELASNYSLHHAFSNNIILGWITEIKGRKESTRPGQGASCTGKYAEPPKAHFN